MVGEKVEKQTMIIFSVVVISVIFGVLIYFSIKSQPKRLPEIKIPEQPMYTYKKEYFIDHIYVGMQSDKGGYCYPVVCGTTEQKAKEAFEIWKEKQIGEKNEFFWPFDELKHYWKFEVKPYFVKLDIKN